MFKPVKTPLSKIKEPVLLKKPSKFQEMSKFFFKNKKETFLFFRTILFLVPCLLLVIFTFLSIFFLKDWSSGFNYGAIGNYQLTIFFIIAIVLFFLLSILLFRITIAIIILFFNVLYVAFGFWLLNYVNFSFDFISGLMFIIFFFLGSWRMSVTLNRYKELAVYRASLFSYMGYYQKTEFKSFFYYFLPFLFALPVYSFSNLFWWSNLGGSLIIFWLAAISVYLIFFYFSLSLWFFSSNFFMKKVLLFRHPVLKLFEFLMQKNNLFQNYLTKKIWNKWIWIFISLILLFVVLIPVWICVENVFYHNEINSVWTRSEWFNYGYQWDNFWLFKNSTVPEFSKDFSLKFISVPGNISNENPEYVLAFPDSLTTAETTFLTDNKWELQTDYSINKLYKVIFKNTLIKISLTAILPTLYFLLRYGWRVFLTYILAWIVKLGLLVFFLWATGGGLYINAFAILFVFYFFDVIRFDNKIQNLKKTLLDIQESKSAQKIISNRTLFNNPQKILIILGVFVAMQFVILTSPFSWNIGLGLLVIFSLMLPLVNFLETLFFVKLTLHSQKNKIKLKQLYEQLPSKYGKESSVPGLNG